MIDVCMHIVICKLSWTPGQDVHFLDNPGEIWTVGNYVCNTYDVRNTPIAIDSCT